MPLSPVLLRLVALLLLCAGLTLPARAQAPAVDPAWQVSLITFSPGALYWERFGHNAILLRHPGRGIAWVFNYGIFDFHQKNFFLNFARGRMYYRLDVQTLEDTLRWYGQAGRWAYEQELALDPAQRQALADYLLWNAEPQHAEYRYDYFLANCSTRVRDAIDRVLGGALQAQLEARPTGVSFRHEATRLIAPDRGLMLAMDAALGPSADRPIDLWAQSFVPMVLRDALRTVQIASASGPRPLVASERWLLRSGVGDGPPAPPRLWPWQLLAGIGLALALVARPRRPAAGMRVLQATLGVLLLGAMALAGLVLLLMWTLTDHWAAWANRNLLLLSPLLLLLLPACWASRREHWQPARATRIVAALALLAALASLPLQLLPEAQAHAGWIALLLPLHLAFAWRFWRPRARG